jgi:quinol-cytochrome oxidoreductase complex cytochrome b subunit
VIFVLLLVITIIVVDRMLFIIRKVTKNPNDYQAMILDHEDQSNRDDFSKYTLLVKAIMHVTLIILVHYYFFFMIPRKTNRCNRSD